MSQGWGQGGGPPPGGYPPQGGYPQQPGGYQQPQGGYQQQPQGGYQQQPQGGYQQQQPGGYQPPPGAPPPGGPGYGPPPGGGYGPPPGGGGDGWPAPPGGGGGGADGGFARFLPGIVVGGVISGVLSTIPLLNVLNCCFCLLDVAGVLGGMAMHMARSKDDKITMAEAAGFGAAAGAIGGVIAGVGNLILRVALGALLIDFYRSVSPALEAQMRAGMSSSILAVPGYVILFAGFGALAGILGISVFWKDRQPQKP